MDELLSSGKRKKPGLTAREEFRMKELLILGQDQVSRITIGTQEEFEEQENTSTAEVVDSLLRQRQNGVCLENPNAICYEAGSDRSYSD
jgi:hypothetical protein